MNVIKIKLEQLIGNINYYLVQKIKKYHYQILDNKFQKFKNLIHIHLRYVK